MLAEIDFQKIAVVYNFYLLPKLWSKFYERSVYTCLIFDK